MHALAARFAEESNLELHAFLRAPLASILQAGLRETDARDDLGETRTTRRIPAHDSGTASGRWAIKGPPHKWRYCVLRPRGGPSAASPSPSVADASPEEEGEEEEILRSLQDELFPSAAFRAWITIVSSLLPLRYSVEARRLRPGLDYTLATSEEGEARLDVVLGLTPEVREADTANGSGKGKGKRRAADPVPRGWETGEWGGWEVSPVFLQ
jgi:hypothetical protein